MKRVLFIILICAAVLFANTRITLRDSSSVSAEVIRLGQIAEISGAHKSVLDTLIIGNSAPAGTTRFLMRTNILTAIPEEMRNSVNVSGSERVRVSTVSQSIPFTKLAKIAGELLADRLINNKNVQNELSFEFAQEAEINIPLGDFEVILGNMDRIQQLRGRFQVPLIIVQENGQRRTRVSINALVKVTANVGVATKNMVRGDTFSADFVEMRSIDITNLQGTPLFEMPKRDEFMIVGVIREGTVITNRHVAPRPAVEIGSAITMVTSGSFGRVSASGRARSAGGIGDVILVENTNSNKLVRGKIIQPGVVEVLRGGRI